MEKDKKRFYKYCVVPMCQNNTNTAPDKVYFFMPKGDKARKKWCKAMRRDNVSSLSCLYCCEDHFNVEEDTENLIQYKIMALEQGQKVTLRLKKGVVPHVFQCQKKDKLQPPPERKVAMKRKRQALVEEALADAAVSEVEEEECIAEVHLAKAGPSGVSVPYHMHVDLNTSNNKINEEAVSVPISNVNCKHMLHQDKARLCKLNVRYNRSKDANTKNISAETVSLTTQSLQLSILSTGDEPECSSSESNSVNEDESDRDSQFKNLMRSCSLVAMEMEPKISLGVPKKTYYIIKLLSKNIPLPTIDILLTLRKIKLNETFSLLALNFGYSQSTVSRIFSKSIVLISEKMKELIFWPTPFQIFEKLPISFRARYDNVVSIIDCLEIEIEKPTNPVHQSLTWSQYKKCNTLKYLISYAPDGLVNYISEGYSGGATDQMIVEDCGFLDYLTPHKAVMADQGFKDITHLLENKNCMLVRPPSVFQSTPSGKAEVKQSKQAAALRVHVKRVKSRLREFKMLLPHAYIERNLIALVDEVIIVACGLINLQDMLLKT